MVVSSNNYFSNSIQGVPQVGGDIDLFANDASPKFHLGYKVETADGRVFRYSHFGAAVTYGGTVVSTDVSGSETVENALVPVASASAATTTDGLAGYKYIEITEPSITTDQFAGGYLTVIAGTGRGYTYRIRGNTSCNLSDAPASGNIRMELYDKLQASLNAASDINVIGCPYSNLIGALVGTDEVPVGVTTRGMTATYYGWVQTKGVCAVQVNTTTTCAIGDILVLAAVAGTGEIGTVASMGQYATSKAILANEPLVGVCLQTVTDAANGCYVGARLMLE
jgi:hypothetical protein